jgi:hypothetical protein
MRDLPFVKEIVDAEVAIADECLDELRPVSVVSKIRTSDNEIHFLRLHGRDWLLLTGFRLIGFSRCRYRSPSIGLTSSQVWAKVKFGP